MIKTLTFILLAVIFIILPATGQITADSIAVEDLEPSSNAGWIGAAIALVIAVIPTIAWAKGKYRLGKFVILAKSFYDKMEDGKLDAKEQSDLARQFRELVAKEEPDLVAKDSAV